MSDTIKHECGIAFVRLLKPLDFYLKKYGTPFYGLNKMQILMEKQHNRDRTGPDWANIKLFPKPGHVYINRIRSNDDHPDQGDIPTHIRPDRTCRRCRSVETQ